MRKVKKGFIFELYEKYEIFYLSNRKSTNKIEKFQGCQQG